MSHQEKLTHPTHTLAVLTVWAEASKLEATANFYQEVLGVKPVEAGNPYILNADGTFLVIMEGTLQHPEDVARRWPLFALTVPSLDESLEQLSKADIALPWGIEEYGEPEPYSRYVMFNDPAGNLIELVEWLN